MKHQVKTKGVCPSAIKFDLDGDKVHNVSFEGGCPGNLAALPILVEGFSASELDSKLGNIKCGHKNTSCAAELSRVVNEALNNQ